MKKKICYILTIATTVNAFFLDQLNYLVENGYDVSVICFDDINLSEKLHNIKLYNVDFSREIDIKGLFKVFGQVYQIIKKEKFDLIQYSTPIAAFVSSIAGNILKVPVRNYHIMGYKFDGFSGFKKKLLMSFEKIACKNSTHIECISKGLIEKGLKYNFFNKEKVVIVGAGSTGGVNTNKFDINKKEIWRKEIREKYNISSADVVYCFLGRICKDKGINELISAFSEISCENKKLLLVGPEHEVIENINQNNIILTGLVNDPERYISASDVVMLPSYREGFGNVLIEAQTMGVPCIASNIDGPKDAMLNNKTGILVEPKNVDDLKNAMEKLLDKELRNTFSKNAIEFAKNFDSKLVCKNILMRKKLLL